MDAMSRHNCIMCSYNDPVLGCLRSGECRLDEETGWASIKTFCAYSAKLS